MELCVGWQRRTDGGGERKEKVGYRCEVRQIAKTHEGKLNLKTHTHTHIAINEYVHKFILAKMVLIPSYTPWLWME